MRKDRIPFGIRPLSEHYLVMRISGKNRHQPGQYVCACGATYTGLNKFESHRAESRKAS